ncbi:IclR family transcriptional regulator [Mesorhizobium sp. CAU 1741]|uniref:IclR family transcriptional regulator n=1 Tax=Mesorhizobium sp. CAU 1741 TaxID=3140366 RepID=UPI00325C2EA1
MVDPDTAAPGTPKRRDPVDVTREETSVSLERLAIADEQTVRDAASSDDVQRTTVQSVLRAIDIIEVLANANRPLRLQEIADGVGLKTPTCHHLLNSLVTRDFATRLARPRSYSLGPRIAQLARQNRSRFDIVQAAQVHMAALVQKTGASVCLATLEETRLGIVTELIAPAAPDFRGWRGDLARAAHATAIGKAILAWLPETQIARVVAEHDLTPFTEFTIQTLGELVENLRQVRRHGFAVEDREFHPDTSGIACALRDKSGAVVGAIGCLIYQSDASIERLRTIQLEINAAALAMAPSIP